MTSNDSVEMVFYFHNWFPLFHRDFVIGGFGQDKNPLLVYPLDSVESDLAAVLQSCLRI